MHTMISMGTAPRRQTIRQRKASRNKRLRQEIRRKELNAQAAGRRIGALELLQERFAEVQEIIRKGVRPATRAAAEADAQRLFPENQRLSAAARVAEML